MSVSVKRLEKALSAVITKAPIIPVKTEQGIIVGNVLIESCENLKNLWQHDQLVYPHVNLNVVAIKLANVLAKQGRVQKSNELYAIDQDYGRWLLDSQYHYKNYQKSKLNKDYDRADVLWARYCESHDRCRDAKQKAERLSVL
jgi:hypothetical protein